MYVARSTATTRILSIDLKPGSRLPAYCTSLGRVLLAGLPDAELDSYFSRVKLVAYTNRTVVDEAQLREIIADVRHKGYAVVEEELEIGLRSIAVPVRGASGSTMAALNVGAQAARITRSEVEQTFLPALLNAATELAVLLP